MKQINWHVFQATAALLGGRVASGKPPASLADLYGVADKSFVKLYLGLEQIAKRIEAMEDDSPVQ